LPDTSEYRSTKNTQAPFHTVQFKASHNSYEMREHIGTQLRFNSADPARYGCRQIEFDLHQDAGGFEWSVKHRSGDADADLTQFLSELLRWSDDRSRHDVIVVMLDLKRVDDDIADFPDNWDAYLRRSFDAGRLALPVEVRVGNPVMWPRLVDLRDKFIFCLSGDEEHKSEYARQLDRLCFADRALGPASIHRADFPSDPRIFVNFNGGHWKHRTQGPVLPPGYISRVCGIDNERQWRLFASMGFNALATDNVRSSWGEFDSLQAFSGIG